MSTCELDRKIDCQTHKGIPIHFSNDTRGPEIICPTCVFPLEEQDNNFVVFRPNDIRLSQEVLVKRVLFSENNIFERVPEEQPLFTGNVENGAEIWVDKKRKVHHYHLLLNPRFSPDDSDAETLQFLKKIPDGEREKINAAFGEFSLGVTSDIGMVLMAGEENIIFGVNHEGLIFDSRANMEEGRIVSGRWQGKDPFVFRISLDREPFFFEVVLGNVIIGSATAHRTDNAALVLGVRFIERDYKTINNKLLSFLERGDYSLKRLRKIVDPYFCVRDGKNFFN